jgi:hypothetical protein
MGRSRELSAFALQSKSQFGWRWCGSLDMVYEIDKLHCVYNSRKRARLRSVAPSLQKIVAPFRKKLWDAAREFELKVFGPEVMAHLCGGPANR